MYMYSISAMVIKILRATLRLTKHHYNIQYTANIKNISKYSKMFDVWIVYFARWMWNEGRWSMQNA